MLYEMSFWDIKPTNHRATICEVHAEPDMGNEYTLPRLLSLCNIWGVFTGDTEIGDGDKVKVCGEENNILNWGD